MLFPPRQLKITKIFPTNYFDTIMLIPATVVLMASTKAFQAFGTGSNPVSRSNS